MAILVSPEVSSIYRTPVVRVISNTSPKIISKLDFSRTGKSAVGIRVSLSIKDVEDVKVLNLGDNVGLYGQLSAPVKESTNTMPSSSKQSEDEEEKRNYYLNAGYAIRTLREEFPALFYRELSFNIYRFDSRYFALKFNC